MHDAVNAILKKLGIGGLEASAPSSVATLAASPTLKADSGAQRIMIDIPREITVNSTVNVTGAV